MGLSYSLFPPGFDRLASACPAVPAPYSVLQAGSEMLGVHLLCSFGGDNAPGTRDVLLLLQVTSEGVNKTSASG